jgi:hypothetical protein
VKGEAVRRRFAIASGPRAAVLCALVANGLILVLVVATTPGSLAFAAPIAPAPAVLLALGRRPAAFRFLALVLGLLYGVAAVAAIFVGGMVFAPAAIALICAAASPALDADPDARRRRHLCYLGSAIAAFTLLGAGLIVHAV